jgi:tetratricopeptide (TPR) repeat protein
MDKLFLSGLKIAIAAFFICISVSSLAIAQHPDPDSLSKLIRKQKGSDRIKSLLILVKSGDGIDSVKNDFILNEISEIAEKEDHDESTLAALYEIGTLFFQQNLPKYAIVSANKGLAIATYTGNINYQISNDILLSQNYFFLHQIEKSNQYLELASHLADQHDHVKYKASILNTRANNASQLGYTLEAIYLYQQTADVLKEENNMGDLGIVYDNIGLLYISLNNHEKAIPYFHSAITLINRYGSEQTLLNTYVNLGVCYKESDSLNKADEYYKKAVKLAKQLRNIYQQARVYLNMANLKSALKDYTAAKEYLDISLDLCIKNEIVPGIIFNKINLGELYIDINQPGKGLQVLKEAEYTAAGFSFPDQMAECYRLMSLAYEKLNNPDDALYYYKKHFSLKDSITKANNVLHADEMENRLEMEQSLKEYSSLKENILTTRANNQILIIAFLSLLLSSGAMASYLYLKKKRAVFNTRIAQEESERLRLNIDNKNKELASKAIQMSALNEMSLDLAEKLGVLLPGLNKAKTDFLQKIIYDLKKGTPESIWEEFEIRFEQVHVEFSKNLQAKFPNLTPNEIKICSFLRLSLTTKEIAMLTNRTTGTIDNARSAIRKKMDMGNDENLTSYLLSI